MPTSPMPKRCGVADKKDENTRHGDTAREFLVRVLGDRHVLHTVMARWERDKKVIGLRCSCGQTIEFYLSKPLGQQAVSALKSVPPEGPPR